MDFDEIEYLEKTVENPDAKSDSDRRHRSSSRHRDRERSSSRHRERSPHRERSLSRRDRERSSSRLDRERSPSRRDGERSPSRRDRERSSSRRDRERSPSRRDRERSESRRDRERSPSRHRERSESRQRERSPSRHRERSSSRHHSSPDRRREREERERERERRSRSRSERRREEERERESRRYKEKKEEVAEPEADPERDQRTVFAFQIALKADERDVYEFFSRAGKVRDVRLIMDRNSRRSKGVGYIEFYDALSVPMAIALSGQPLLGQAVMVKPSEAEKNLVQSTATIAGVNGVGPYSGGARRLYVGNLHFNITEEQLRLVFEPFGAVELVQLPREPETGHCKGYGFIQFQRLEDARAALSLNGQLDIAGRSIKVSAVTDQVGMQDVGTNAGDLDDDEGGGLSLNAHSRALLMQKLDRTGTITSASGALLSPVVNSPLLTPGASTLGVVPLLQAPAFVGLPTPGSSVLPSTIQPVNTAGTPTECLLLTNMFDPNVETDPDFDLDIKEDVEEECTKYGTLKHIFVDKNTAGCVYLRFEDTSSAMSAQRALQGRWFAGKMITATFMTPQSYETKFPSSS